MYAPDIGIYLYFFQYFAYIQWIIIPKNRDKSKRRAGKIGNDKDKEEDGGAGKMDSSFSISPFPRIKRGL